LYETKTKRKNNFYFCETKETKKISIFTKRNETKRKKYKLWIFRF